MMNLANLASTTLTELSLSADNVMVWALILARLDIPARLHRRVLASGIALALVLRVGAIGAGAALLGRFAWLSYVLGVVLVWTAYRVLRDDGADMRIPRGVSPMLAGVAALGVTDLVFAVDSIPASFGITRDPTVIIIANAVALAALWTMYGVVSAMMARLTYLTHGLAAVLAWIGLTMLLPVRVPELVNLAVIVVALATAAAMSYVLTPRVTEGTVTV